MRIIAIANQKGGAGKTTTVVHLATALALLKRRVLLVDMDGQGNATKYLGAVADGTPLLDALCGERELKTVIQKTKFGVDVIGSGTQLEGIDVVLYAAKKDLATRQLRRCLRALQNEWDYVLIDCPPNLGVATVSALLAATDVLIPVQTESMAVEGMLRLSANLEEMRSAFEIQLPIIGVLACMCVEREKLTQEIIQLLQEHFGSLLFKTRIKRNAKMPQSYAAKVPLHTFDPKNELLPQYEALARELVKRCEKRRKVTAVDVKTA